MSIYGSVPVGRLFSRAHLEKPPISFSNAHRRGRMQVLVVNRECLQGNPFARFRFDCVDQAAGESNIQSLQKDRKLAFKIPPRQPIRLQSISVVSAEISRRG